MVFTLYDEFVCLPRTEEDWAYKCKGFIENYELSCVEAWDGFHVHVACRLKNYFIFKNKYIITNMGLILRNKRFLHLTTGASGSTHNTGLVRYSTLFKDIQGGGGVPNKSIILGDFGEILLVTIGDKAFPRKEWLLKCFSENTRDLKKRYYNTKLCSARVVIETFMVC